LALAARIGGVASALHGSGAISEQKSAVAKEAAYRSRRMKRKQTAALAASCCMAFIAVACRQRKRSKAKIMAAPQWHLA